MFNKLASARNLRGGEQVLKGDVSEAAEYWADAHDTRKLSTVHWFADKPAATVSGRSGKTVAAVSGRSDIPVVTISGSLGSHSAAASNTAPGPEANDVDPDFNALQLPLPQGNAEEDMYTTNDTASSPATAQRSASATGAGPGGSSNSGRDDVIENVSGIMTQQNPDNSGPASKVSTRKRSLQSKAAMVASSDAPNLPRRGRDRPASSGRANAASKKAKA
ncbi:hypothetical protein ABBQ38_007920 [Trebouxia sp. C0009 RCD-2024]